MSLTSTTTRPCYGKTIPQTLFLGASVSNFTVNLGWGQQASSLTVNLVNDTSSYCGTNAQLNMPNAGVGDDDHYHNNDGDDLYVGRDPNTGRGILRGKVYYAWSNNKFVSRYWTNQDPGFFGMANRWSSNGVFTPSSTNSGYDIIGNPVYFRMQDFEFSGIIKNWDYNEGSGGATSSVTIESPTSLLSNSYVIVGEYAGSIFGKLSSASIGGPKNYTGPNLIYNGTVRQGAIHNVFNVFGFMEDLGFGKADVNDQGMPVSKILNALSVLTSNTDETISPKFSPFKRLIGRIALQQNNNAVSDGFYSFGMFPCTSDSLNTKRHTYILDLSELPRPDSSIRIQGPVISILDLITQVADIAAKDFFVELIPSAYNNNILPIIKIRTVTRFGQPATNVVKSTVEAISNTYKVSNRTYGQEYNAATNRIMLIGGPQQRLFQAKNYRLAYTQTNYMYESSTNTFTNYKRYPISKWKIPSFLSTRMPDISANINGNLAWLFGDEDTIKRTAETVGTNSRDNLFRDTTNGPGFNSLTIEGPNSGLTVGNYKQTNSSTPNDGFALQLGNPSLNSTNRYIPLLNDIITPFFGFRYENRTGNTEGLPEESAKQPRPVFMDTVTGQLLVMCDIEDLPPLKYGIRSIYPGSRFVVSESEMRAALAGFDNLVLYYAAKTYKPDLLLMLQRTYAASGNSSIQRDDTPFGLGSWGMIEDQNAADTEGYPTNVFADQDEDVNVTNILYSKSYTEDLMVLHGFISEIASKYYGKTYSVRVPDVLGYRDWTVGGNQQIGTDLSGNPVYVWTGTPKTYFNYEVATDGAWEEPGNIIDDRIVVGEKDFYALTDEVGKIQPILAYNASDNFDKTAHFMCNNSILFNSAYRSYKNNPVFGIELYSMHINEFSGGCDNSKFFYPSIDLSSVSENVLIKESLYAVNEPHDTYRIPTWGARKAYVTAQVKPDFYFLGPGSPSSPAGTIPRVVMESPGIFLNSSSLEYAQDPNKTVISNVALEDLMTYLAFTSQNNWEPGIIRSFASRLSHVYAGALLRTKSKKQPNAQMVNLAPKAAHPFFAGIPLKSNRFVYGPWTNYPHIDMPNMTTAQQENLVADTKVENDSDLVPWNYGGVSVLDKAAMLKIGGEATYQNIIESGSFDIPGLPIFGLGSAFVSGNSGSQFIYSNQGFTIDSGSFEGYNFRVLNYDYSGTSIPVMTNLQATVSDSKINTSYSLKIYSKPLSRFNKEAADRLKRIAKQNIKLNQRDANSTKKIVSQQIKILQDSVSRGEGGFEGFSTKGASQKLLGWSPVGVIIGGGSYFGAPPVKGRIRSKKRTIRSNQRSRNPGVGSTTATNSDTNTPVNFVGSRGDWSINSSFSATQSGNLPYDQSIGPINTMIKDMRHTADIFIYQGKETGLSSLQNYGEKAVMSLDGILSPISFYPVRYSSCYSMAKWPLSKCPVCCGNKIYTENISQYDTNGGNASVPITKFCSYCYDDVNMTPEKTLKDKKNNLLEIPPYIIVNNTNDNRVLSGLDKEFNDTMKISKNNKIGLTTIQPILQSNGDFKHPDAQNMDKKRHSISIVGRGGVNHGDAVAGITEIIIKNNYENNNYGANPDFNGEVDLRLNRFLEKATQARANLMVGNCTSISSYPLNNRFIGLRGPLMMHGWGYDLNGYPVPNAADEPKEINPNGVAKRHKKIQRRDINNNLILDKDGKITYEDDYSHPGGFPGELPSSDLGSIIGKTQQYTNGKWTKPTKSEKFYLNWGERPDLWPVGPIDLRWDEHRKVWTSPQPKVYKNIYITLEEDLFSSQSTSDTIRPARGFISDLEYETTSGQTRKIVFVVDESGYTAPRGAKLLCAFNPDKGFYEVISRQSFIVLGTIQSSGSQATLALSYVQNQNRSLFIENTLTASFSNPLNFNVSSGQRGMFSYMNNEWVLISVN